VRLVAISALVLVAGCDGLFGLTHVPNPDGDAAIDASGDGATSDSLVDAKMIDAFVPKTCNELGYTRQVSSGSTTWYRNGGTTKKTWINAELDCADDSTAANDVHTHLVVLSNDQEAGGVHVDVLFSADAGGYWTGLTDRVAPGTYRWVTNEGPGYPPSMGSPWGTGQPNGSGGCVVFDNFSMFDVSCIETHFFACECDAFPQDSTHF
jgi:hypothetical protein